MVTFSAMGSASAALDFERELLEQISVRLRIDLATQQLARAGDRERRDFLAELLHARDSIRASLPDAPRRPAADLPQPRCRAPHRPARSNGDSPARRSCRRCACASLTISVADAFASARLFSPFSAEARPSAILRATLVDRRDQRRPDELHRHPREDEEDQQLDEQRCVQIHGSACLARSAKVAVPRGACRTSAT